MFFTRSLKNPLKYPVNHSILPYLSLKSKKMTFSLNYVQPKRHGTAYYLSKTEGGKTKMLYIPKVKLEAVKKGVESYNEYKDIGKEICRINEEIIRLEKEEGKK